MPLPRELSADELVFYKHFATVLEPAEAAAFCGQLDRAQIIYETAEHTRFAIAPDAPRLQEISSATITGAYNGSGGSVVDILVHVAFPAGLIESAERFRTDGDAVDDGAPVSPDQLRLQPRPGQLAPS